jgi:hypothetical protein
MRYFEATLKGYNGSTDATDHLIKWIAAPNAKAAMRAIADKGWKLDRPIEDLPFDGDTLTHETIDLHVEDNTEIHKP